MAESVSIAEARNSLTKLVHEVETGSPITLTRRGKPVAVLLGVEELARLRRGRRRFREAYERFREQFDMEALDIDPDEIFVRSTDPDGGRDSPWA